MSADYSSDDRPIMRCDHDGCPAFVAQANAHTLGWDWFTGWLPATRHFCKKHADSPQRNADFAKSKVNDLSTVQPPRDLRTKLGEVL